MARRLVLLFVLAGCHSSDEMDFRHTRARGGETVAELGDDRITAEELRQRIAEMSPPARARYQTLDEKRDYVEGLARFELLALEARRQGLQNDPDVIETAKKVMVEKLLSRQLDSTKQPLSDAELHAYFDSHRANYEQPERVRLFAILFRDGDGGSRRSQAERVLVDALQKPAMDLSAFGELARRYSEDARSRLLEGDLRFLTKDELTERCGASVAEWAFRSSELGEVALLAGREGLELVKRVGHQPALRVSFEQARPQLEAALAYEKRAAAYEALIDGLKRRYGYRIHDEAIARVPVDVSAPAIAPSRQTPGYLPPAHPASRELGNRGVAR